MKIRSIGISILICCVLAGCGRYVPDSASDRWGWERRDLYPGKSTYEKSLMYKYVYEERLHPRSEWRVLNHMLYYLLTEKADGVSSFQAQDFLKQLRPYHFQYDSGKVAEIYEKAFVGEDLRLDKDASSPNAFLYDDLALKRLPQVIRWGGFEQVKGLNVWGKVITRLGPLKNIRFGEKHVEGIASDGYTYKAEEGKDMELMIVKVESGPSDKFEMPPDMFTQETPSFRTARKFAKGESAIKRMESGRTLSVAVDYDPLAIRQIGLVTLPCPNIDGLWINDPRPSAQALFYNSAWDGHRIAIDISANVGEFVDSGGIAEFDFKYTVTGLKGSSAELAEETIYVRDSVGEKGGYTRRVITRPFPGSYDSCNVSVVLTAGEKALRKDSLVTLDSGSFPLEIISGNGDQLPSSGLPFFLVGPAERGKEYRLFFAVKGLSKRPGDSLYSGFVAIMLLPPEAREGIVKSGEITILGKDHQPGIEPGITREQVISGYGDKLVATMDIDSEYPAGYFMGDFTVPQDAQRGPRILAVEFFSFADSQYVDEIGEAYKVIQIK
jgi:hypothetical protein